MKKLFLLTIGIFLFNSTFVYSYFTENSSTPEIEYENIELLINEVSFKDKKNDWVELLVIDDGNNGNGSKINGFYLKDDSKFVEIESNFTVFTDDFIIITFKKSENSYYEDHILYIDIEKSGLTGTTEQVILFDPEDNITDAVCWQNSSPTASELEDLEEIIIEDEWSDDCINSEEIKNNQSIGRTSSIDTDSSDDWEIFENPTKGAKNIYINDPPEVIITIQSGDIEGYPPLSINLDGSASYDPENEEIEFFWDYNDGYTYETANPPSHKFENPGEYEITLEVTDNIGQTSSDSIIVTILEEKVVIPEETNVIPSEVEGSLIIPADSSVIPADSSVIPAEAGIYPDLALLSTSIILNEFLPNPEGSDSGNEWIELKNLSDQNLVLTGLIIDDEDGGSKPYSLDNLEIAAHDFLVIYSSESKISLNNSEEKARLLLEDGQLLEEIYYEKSTENMSFARDNNNNFLETAILTPGAENIFSEDNSSPADTKASSNNESNKSQTVNSTSITAITSTDDKKKSSTKTDKYTPDRIYQNGNLSENIIISEAFPNPKGKDGDKEWLEIYNPGPEDINLGNWALDDDEKGSKPYVFPDTTIIKSQKYLVIPVTETEIPLANSADEIHLIDFEDNIISEIFYESAKEDHSYAFNKTIKLPEETEESNYIWTSNHTKGEENPISYNFKATITSITPPSSFSVSFNNLKFNILYNPKIFPEDQISNILHEGNEINILAQKIDDSTYELQEIELITLAATSEDENESENTPIDPIPIALGSTTALSTSFLVYSKYKTQITELLKKLLKK